MLSFKNDLTNRAHLLDERQRVKLFIHANTRICTLKSCMEKPVLMRICLFYSFLSKILTVHLRVSGEIPRLLNSERVRVAAQMS